MPYRVLKHVVIILVVIFVTGSMTASAQPKIEYQKSAHDYKQAIDNPITVNIKSFPPSDEVASKNDENWNHGIGAFQSLIFVLQLVAFIVQACWMRATVREMRKGTKATIRAAKAAARSADAADLSARTAAIVELPILHVDRVENEIPYHNNIANWIDYFVPNVVINNYGRTPAFDVVVTTNIKIVPFLPSEPIYEIVNPYPDKYVIEAGKPVNIPEYLYMHKLQLLPQHEIALRDGAMLLFVYGRITYKDCWDGRYECGFIFYWLGNSDKFVQAPPSCENYRYHRKIA